MSTMVSNFDMTFDTRGQGQNDVNLSIWHAIPTLIGVSGSYLGH